MPALFDDDQKFVMDMLSYIGQHYTVHEANGTTSDEFRGAVIEVELSAGDIFKITIEEQHG
jgi:hypothetical protein